MTDTATDYDIDTEEYAEYYVDEDGNRVDEQGNPYIEGEYEEVEGEDEPEVEVGSEVAVIEHVATVIEEVAPFTERQAITHTNKVRAARDKLGTNAEKLFDLVEQAAQGRVHEALGMAWTAWVAENAQIQPKDDDQRKDLLIRLSAKGFSTRAAAKMLGTSQSTATRIIAGAGESFDSPTVIGLDGVEQSRTKAKKKQPKPEPEPVEELRTATEVISDFSDEIDTLLINVQAFKDVLDDELFPKARKRIGQRFVKRLNVAINDLNAVLEVISE